jgi:hypothetical protein
MIERSNRTGELRPIRPYSAYLFTEDLDNARGPQGVNLPSMILLGIRRAGIAVFQHCQFATDFRNGQSRCEG